MNKYWEHLKYTLRHKWYVFIECYKVGLYWQGIIHDWTKFLPSEFGGYAEFFFGPKYGLPDSTTTKYTDTKCSAFEYAWLHHQKSNKHHWDWWVMVREDGTLKPLAMPYKYRMEMICDWIGASKAKGKTDLIGWYNATKHRRFLHPDTQAWVEKHIGIEREKNEKHSGQ